MKKDIVKTDEFSALVDEIWEIIRQATAQVKSEKEENKMTKKVYVPLVANYSYHYCGYDGSDPWGFFGYTYPGTEQQRPTLRQSSGHIYRDASGRK